MIDNGSDETEAPLDPAAERLRRKLVRLLMVSGGFMVLGLIAVFGAIVYRLSGAGDPATRPATIPGAAVTEAQILPQKPPVESRLALPAGARLISADLDGGRALLTVETPEGVVLLLVELPSGRILGRYRLE